MSETIAKFYTQKLPLCKRFGYAVSECTFRDAYAIQGICPQEGTTQFSGHIYIISARARISISMVLVSVGLA